MVGNVQLAALQSMDRSYLRRSHQQRGMPELQRIRHSTTGADAASYRSRCVRKKKAGEWRRDSKRRVAWPQVVVGQVRFFALCVTIAFCTTALILMARTDLLIRRSLALLRCLGGEAQSCLQHPLIVFPADREVLVGHRDHVMSQLFPEVSLRSF